MKNFWFALGAVLLISSCSDKKEEQTQVSELSTEQALEAGEQIVAKPQFDIKFEEITYHYDAANLPGKCDKGSESICSLNAPLITSFRNATRKSFPNLHLWKMRVCSVRLRPVSKSSS